MFCIPELQNMTFLYLILHLGSVFIIDTQSLRIDTRFGSLDGLIDDVSFNGTNKQVAKFYGIPFAEPPVGNLRFSKPLPKPRLQEVYNATYQRPACMQVRNTVPKSEDCLYLNVYVPYDSVRGVAAMRAKRYPVMVWIFGGSFLFGSTHIYHGEVLSAFNDVIVVTVNYRLNIFGFLSTFDSASLGNYGLWDQHLGIKWVHDNIDDFGGDPAKVTIFGESAGSVSVLYQALYPGNKGLFQNVIAESGTPFTIWAFNTRGGYMEQYTRNFASIVGCHNLWSKALVACLRQKSATELVNNFQHVKGNLSLKISFSPVEDGYFIQGNHAKDLNMLKFVNYVPGMSNASLEFFRSLNIIVGYNNQDGGSVGLFSSLLYKYNKGSLENGVPRTVFEQSVSVITKGLFNVNNYLLNHAVLLEYTDWRDPNDPGNNLQNAVALSTDYSFLIPTLQTLNAHSVTNQHASSYLYMFSHPPYNRNRRKWLTGANHFDEVAYVFGYPSGLLDDSVYNTEMDKLNEVKVSSMIMTMWTNFAKSGDPNKPVDVGMTSVWPQYDFVNRSYVDIDVNMTNAVKQRYEGRKVALWLQFVPELLEALGLNNTKPLLPDTFMPVNNIVG